MNDTIAIGRIVLFNVDEELATRTAKLPMCKERKILPATIVSLNEPEEEADELTVNLKVHLDGAHPDTWRSGTTEGTGPGQFQFPMKEYDNTEEEVKEEKNLKEELVDQGSKPPKDEPQSNVDESATKNQDHDEKVGPGPQL